MKRILITASLTMVALGCQMAFASNPPSGLLFNVSASSNVLTVSRVITSQGYDNVGVRVTTPGYSIPQSNCRSVQNGLCAFNLDNSSPQKTITLSGPTTSAPIDLIICANAAGPTSCQNYQANQSNGFAFVTNDDSDTVPVSRCSIGAAGVLSNCVSGINDASFPSGYNYPQGITFNNQHTFAYITSYDDGQDGAPLVVDCAVTGNFLHGCNVTTFTTPTGFFSEYGMIALSPTNNYAYIPGAVDITTKGKKLGAPSELSTVVACPIVGGHITQPCTDTGYVPSIDSQRYVGITLNPAGTRAYIGSYYNDNTQLGYINICDVNNTNGTFSNCTYGNYVTNDDLTFGQPVGLAFNPSGSILYVADYANQMVYGCSLDASKTTHAPLASRNGAPPPLPFTTCIEATNQIQNPWGITINKAGTVAYVTDYSETTYSCPINSSTGAFGTCALTTGFQDPVGIALTH